MINDKEHNEEEAMPFWFGKRARLGFLAVWINLSRNWGVRSAGGT